MEEKFIKKDTRVFTVFASVLLILLSVVVLVIGLISNKLMDFSLWGGFAVLLVGTVLMGALQIRVFSNYKSQSKMLCTDGIAYICLDCLIALISLLKPLKVNGIIKFNLEYLICAFAFLFAVWKIITSIFALKNKHYNGFLEIVAFLLWVLFGVGVLLYGKGGNLLQTGKILFVISNFLIVIWYVFYMLFSYIFKEPNYLVTEAGKELLKSELEMKQSRINRLNGKVSNAETEKKEDKEESLEEKLTKLQSLRDRKFITDEEYEEKRKELLDKSI